MWKHCDIEKPKEGVPVLVYKPDTLYSTCYERPLDVALFDGNRYSCHIQPDQWMYFDSPDDWTDEHTKYQGMY